MSDPTVIRDIMLMRNHEGYSIVRQRGEERLNRLFIPDSDVLRFTADDDWPTEDVQFSFYAAIRYSSLRRRSIELHQGLLMTCTCCGHLSPLCDEVPTYECLTCSGRMDEMEIGEIIRDEPLPGRNESEAAG